jgi:DnaJ like chaperone protein
MSWRGVFLGAVIGLLTTRSALGALVGALIGYLIDQSGAFGPGTRDARAPHSISISDEFFRTTFELMGHVAKSDGRVSEAEIDAARRLMQELKLGPREIGVAIDCFRAGKSAAYDAEVGVERLREACGQRHDLLRAFMELQLRAALAGNGISPPARAILARAAERLGMSVACTAAEPGQLCRRGPHRSGRGVAVGLLFGVGGRRQHHRSRSDQGLSAANEPPSS